ncbi:serine-type D-Ala-D-Ala carboxypeptidase [Veronia nyctiphanis]|uniref:Serine-type D-Ala-D-Ala carboxypeptidase n=1 Tax=Veronia nyctiphanis TaxID=1278244 RepID=A0A4Q0YUH0_9GAMM|nr:serine-type D-Ala-D-Ala carboxypeptidase [Veronia nyctiphanis]RXJ73804.1 serine-type D-Ala-D-Ala carboxypeptidase [Veronia nyctiphanis]
MRPLILSLLLCVSFSSYAVSLPTINALLPEGHQLALSVVDPSTNQTRHTFSANKLLPPASTQKLVTALAVTLTLPEHFRFTTQLTVAQDNLVIHFSGDPTLTRSDLKGLLQQARQKGIRVIKGDLWIDNTAFSGYERAIGWPWDILGVCYSAPSSAVVLEHNCFQGSIYTDSRKGTTRTFVPEHQPVTVTTDARTVSRNEQKRTHCELELYTYEHNRYHLSGCLPPRKDPLPLKFALQDPTHYVKSVLNALLRETGIKLLGTIRVGKPVYRSQLIASHHSVTRNTLLNKMLKRSDNLIADNLLKTLGRKTYQVAGTFQNGVAAVKETLLEKTGIDLKTAVLVDGSGLSRNNRMTAEQLIAVLSYIYRHPELGILDMLPVAGIDGTLRYRQSVRKYPIKGKLRAKTGTLFGSYNLAGLIETESGKPLLVAQLVANYHLPESEKPTPRGASPISQFEYALYHALFKSELTR